MENHTVQNAQRSNNDSLRIVAKKIFVRVIVTGIVAGIVLLGMTTVYNYQPRAVATFTAADVVGKVIDLNEGDAYPVELGATSSATSVSSSSHSRAMLFSISTENNTAVSSAESVKLGFKTADGGSFIASIPTSKVVFMEATPFEQPSAEFSFSDAAVCKDMKRACEAYKYLDDKGNFFTHAGRHETADIEQTDAYKSLKQLAPAEVLAQSVERVTLKITPDQFKDYLQGK